MSKPTSTPIFAFAALAEAVLPQDGVAGVWVKVMPAGEFTGRDGRGPFDAGDKTAMQAIIDRSRAFYAGSELMLDYDHQTLFAVGPGKGGTAPASGWFKDFQARDDGIYGLVEWTDAAAGRIKAREYRYLSPLFKVVKGTNKVDRIDNAALVNQSNLPLDAIAAAAERFTHQGDDMNPLLAELAKKLGLADGTAEDAILNAAVAFTADRGKIAVAAGAKAEATTDEVLTAMAAGKSAFDASAYVPMSMYQELEAKFAEGTEKAAGDKAEAAVAEAIKSGRVTPANKDWAIGFAKRDLDGFQAFANRQPALTERQAVPKTPTNSDPELSDTDLQAMSAMGIDREAFIAARKLEKA